MQEGPDIFQQQESYNQKNQKIVETTRFMDIPWKINKDLQNPGRLTNKIIDNKIKTSNIYIYLH